jgi:mRNA interferase YafQ
LRTLHRSSKFKTDFKKAKLSESDYALLKDTLKSLVEGRPLSRNLNDHPLSGNFKGYRELHIKPDLLLVYKITQEELRLARLNSHANIFKK